MSRRPDDAASLIKAAVGQAVAAIEAKQEAIVDRAVEKAIGEALGRFGLNASDPDKISNYHADMRWVRDRRELQQAIIKQGAGAVILGLLGLLGAALAFWFKSGMPK